LYLDKLTVAPLESGRVKPGAAFLDSAAAGNAKHAATSAIRRSALLRHTIHLPRLPAFESGK
jgi:hypothetical protein